jgi:hypothetical protein
MNLTDEQLIEIYHIVFSQIHSNGFMTAEVKDLLFQNDYWFLQRPNKLDWYDDVIEYLNGIGYDLTKLNVNPAIIL